MPGAPAQGVTPEELLAGAWASCFGGAFLFVAGKHGVDAGSARFRAMVTLDSNMEKPEFSISRAELEVELPGVDDAVADEVIEEAHAMCPVSKLFVDGAGDVVVRRAAAVAG
jgi:organic hydroperoxide reductase OsmC/OhrA